VIPESPFVFSIAALSVTLPGFAGLIAAFRRGSEWGTMDLFRVREIIEFGFVNAFLALLTVPLVVSLHEVPRVVSTVCGIAAVYLVVSVALLRRRQRALRLPTTLGWSVPAAVVSGAAFTVALAGLGSGEVAWLLWTLLFLLARPMLAFVFVLVLLPRDRL
jgi:hypothetical protein